MDFPLTIAYNIEDKKVGCVLMQSMLGASFPSNKVGLYFKTEVWDLSPQKLKLYVLSDEDQFNRLVKITNEKKL